MSTNVSEKAIGRLVERFYARVRADALLGPVFEAHVGEDWSAHLRLMVDFWSSVLLRTGRYAGNPRAVHARLPDLGAHHFRRWLSLFELTLAETFEPRTATAIQTRAQAMAQGLLHGIQSRRPGLPLTERETRREVN